MADEKDNPLQQYQAPEEHTEEQQQPASDPSQTYPSQMPPTTTAAGEEQPAQFSAVAAGVTGNKKLFLLVIGALITFALIFYFLPGEKNADQVKSDEQKQKLAERASEIVKESKPIAAPIDTTTVTVAPTISQPPPVIAPQPPEPPPAPTPLAPTAPSFPSSPTATPSIPSFTPDSGTTTAKSGGLFSNDEQERKRQQALDARRKAGIMVTGSGKGGLDSLTSSDSTKKDGDKKSDDTTASSDKTQKKSTDGYLGFGEGSLNEQTLGKTASTQVKATYIGRLDNMIAQGKIIDAVLETAINTDLAGTIRGIVARDVYAESGKAVLVPKGSRLIGSYTTEIKPGQTRVNVIWSRLIRPDGVDLALNSPGTDPLGRAGVTGFIDDKFMTKMSTAFLISYIIPSITNKLSNIKDTPTTSSTATNATTGTTTSTSTGGSTKSQQLQDSATKFQDLTQKTIEQAFSTTTTIYVDQGTRINVFVNNDLIFPAQSSTSSIGVLK